jgi:hypothetical protein
VHDIRITPLRNIQVIARGREIRELPRLMKTYGRGRWRKLKGNAGFNCRTGQFVKPKYIGMKRWASAKKKRRSKPSWIDLN